MICPEWMIKNKFRMAFRCWTSGTQYSFEFSKDGPQFLLCVHAGQDIHISFYRLVESAKA